VLIPIVFLMRQSLIALLRGSRHTHGDPCDGPFNHMPAKAHSADFDGRFREIISDPVNLLIERAPLAGTVIDGYVILHNGHMVPVDGAGAYYGDFSKILIYNRGVHEPVEEFAFQEVLRRLPVAPTMIELGSYWAHYAMWFKQARPNGCVWMVEPEITHIEAGKANFARNGYRGTFIQDFVGKGRFEVDAFMDKERLETLDVLHCDIQGFEGEMIEGAWRTLAERRVQWLFISTHGQRLHQTLADSLSGHGYRIEISSDFETETTSFDGLLVAAHPDSPPLLNSKNLLGREAIANASPADLLKSLADLP